MLVLSNYFSTVVSVGGAVYSFSVKVNLVTTDWFQVSIYKNANHIIIEFCHLFDCMKIWLIEFWSGIINTRCTWVVIGSYEPTLTSGIFSFVYSGLHQSVY